MRLGLPEVIGARTGKSREERQMKLSTRLARLLTTCLLLGIMVSANAEPLPPETKTELGMARLATARYHNLQNALDDGYVNIDVYIPGMGFHYLNPALVDNVFDPAAPELLVYSPDQQLGKLRLVAVEYAVPLGGPAPEGFFGDQDQWSAETDFGIWSLHAWVWLNNPHGMFTQLNPRVD